jgi:predicted nucleotidyltransferase
VIAPIASDLRADLSRIAVSVSGLNLLVLHGSRARGDAHRRSDWDFAYEGDASLDVDGLLAALADRLKVDRIDLVDLDRAGALLRHRVARDGVLVVERAPGLFVRFRLKAIATWCDLAPVLEPLYERVLEALPR